MNRLDRLLDKARGGERPTAEPMSDALVAEKVEALLERVTTGSAARLKRVEARIKRECPNRWASSFGALPSEDRAAWEREVARAVETGNADGLIYLERELKRKHPTYRPDRAIDLGTMVDRLRFLKDHGGRATA